MADGTVVSFYSYKGGVGRTLALANVAAALAGWGYRVLALDWDLEAPGLSHYFRTWVDAPAFGLVDLVEQIAAGEQPNVGRATNERSAARAAGPAQPDRRRLPGSRLCGSRPADRLVSPLRGPRPRRRVGGDAR